MKIVPNYFNGRGRICEKIAVFKKYRKFRISGILEQNQKYSIF
ncbi:hypothetical protein LEP1GSC020_0243 [Leptospira interrogans serovar Grippotyphosa str. 2006006986]|nr:hypothetical protein LEP1GSC020_0243 [Leptospira interrogans serovar Grippotyphosa str. 2006006986]